MGSPKKTMDMTKDFVTHYTSDETDRMVLRLNNGVRSNKYKDVDYDKLKLLATEKKFSAQKSLLKVKKIEQISKQSKENNLMKQHKLVWHKELIRLNNLKKRIQSEVDQHKRQNSIDGSICNATYQHFEDYEAGLDVDFEKFKMNTGEPVWELKEDLQFWIQENLADLKMGVPEVVEKHAEIRATINSVKQQQRQILEKLGHEQKTLEEELGMGELGNMIHEEMDQSIHVVQGIPEEAFELECQDFDLKVNVLQEFIVIDEKFRERLHYLEDQHSLILSKGRHGGWSEDNHFLFTSVYEQYPHEMTNRRKLIIDMLQRHLPHKSRAQLVAHEDWCESNKYFRERKRALMVAWQNGRAQLYLKAKSVFTEADIAAELEEVKIEYLRRQKQVRQALYEKVKKWRDQQLEVMLIQQRLEESQREAMKEQMKRDAELEKKRRNMEKEKISVYHDHQTQKRQEQEEKDRQRLEELHKVMAEQAKFDKERIIFREEQIQRKIEERKKMQDEKEEEEKEKEERLEALREKVRIIAESDPERMMKGTKAWESRRSENFDDINLQKPLFGINTFTSNQVTSDQRIRLEQKLREAGLHNSDYARHVISKAPPPNPPRRDMESTVFKQV